MTNASAKHSEAGHEWYVLAAIPVTPSTATRLASAMIEESRRVTPAPREFTAPGPIEHIDSFEARCLRCDASYLESRGTDCDPGRINGRQRR